MAKVTVLMAVYNAEQWLPKSLASILSQTLDDIQIVCVDDASTDRSLSILYDYAGEDSRIEVIKLSENHGQAHARNVGLQRAVGDYVCFLDADDWLSRDALEQAVSVYEQYPNTDSVLFRVIYVTNGAEVEYPMKPFDVLSGYEAFMRSIDWDIHGVYMVRTSIHQQHPYDETCRSYSDDNTTRIHYLLSSEVRCCQGIYYYLQHSSSTTHQVSVHRFDYLRANESMRQQLIELKVGQDVIARYENVRWLVLVDCYMFYHVHGRELSVEERRYGLSELRRVWQTIDRSLLEKKTIAKFGYRPCGSWRLFRLQEWLYFTIRGFLGKNR